MTTKFSAIYAITLLLANGTSLEPSARAQLFAVEIETTGSQLEPSAHVQTLGWDFTLTSSVIVTDLGVFDAGSNGLFESHRVGIWKMDGTLLVESLIPAGTEADLFQQFRYVPTIPTLLIEGDYVIGAQYVAVSLDQLPGVADSLQSHPNVIFHGGRNGAGSDLPFPDIDRGSAYNYFGPNFAFTAVPEPAAVTAIAGGFLGLWIAIRRKLARHSAALIIQSRSTGSRQVAPDLT